MNHSSRPLVGALARLLSWYAGLALVAGTAFAGVVIEPLPGGCTIENNYGRSMAVLGDGRLAVGSSGEFCGWVDVLDSTGASVGTLRDPDDTSFGRVVGAIGRDVLVGSNVSGRILRIRPDSAAVRAEYVLPEGLPTAVASVGRRVAVLVTRYGASGSTVALLPGAVALGGRGPDTADNGIVRILPR